MATGDVYAGIGVLVKIGSTAIGAQRDAKMHVEAAEIDGGHKGSGGWFVSLAGELKWSLECNALLAENDTVQESLITSQIARTPVTVEMAMPWGDKFAGSARVLSVDVAAPRSDVVTFDVSFGGIGALTSVPGS